MVRALVLGGGCFWCLEAAYQMVRGVTGVTSGYAGGHTTDPSYDRVAAGNTGHAEVVRVEFDPAVVSFDQIMEIFWLIHDPTSLNRQGHDVGTEYRSIILYDSDQQRAEAEASRDAAQKLVAEPIVTEIKLLEHFYEAEPEHQNYFRNHPERAYCQLVINPKLHKLRQKYSKQLKEDA